MVRLIKDSASDPEQLDRVGTRAQEVCRTLASFREALVTQFGPGLMLWASNFRDALDRMNRDARRARWAQQYPVYTCPWVKMLWSVDGAVPLRCERSWDRTLISTPDLRMEVWDHVLAVHLPGEAGMSLAGQVTAKILEGP